MKLDIHTRPKSRELFDRIRSRILEGGHAPGEWLKQADLEAHYGATRSDVRSALSSLAERGIVQYVKNRGFRVFDRSAEELAEISEVLSILEAAAASKIAANAARNDVEHLRTLADAFGSLIEGGLQSELRIANYRFHAAVIALCGNELMARTVQNLRECCAGGPELRYMSHAGLAHSNAEHHQIVSAIRSRDADALRDLLSGHALLPNRQPAQ